MKRGQVYVWPLVRDEGTLLLNCITLAPPNITPVLSKNASSQVWVRGQTLIIIIRKSIGIIKLEEETRFIRFSLKHCANQTLFYYFLDRINWILQDNLFFIFITFLMKVMKNNPPGMEKSYDFVCMWRILSMLLWFVQIIYGKCHQVGQISTFKPSIFSKCFLLPVTITAL